MLAEHHIFSDITPDTIEVRYGSESDSENDSDSDGYNEDSENGQEKVKITDRQPEVQ